MLTASGLVALGMAYHEAEAAAHMLAFLVFPGVFLWAFAAVGLLRVWLVLGGGALLMALASDALQRGLLA